MFLRHFNWNVDYLAWPYPSRTKLSDRREGNLSGGEQQMLAIARTLMGNPKLCLLDKPSERLAPSVVQHLAEQILKLKKEGLTILLCLRFARSPRYQDLST